MAARLSVAFAFLLLAFALFVHTALAGVQLQAPQKVARGDAFLASALSDKPADKFVFSWLGKKISIMGEPAENGGSRAVALLPVPLDEKARSLTLLVNAENSTESSAKTAISLFDRKRPVQKLNVDKKFVEPPASERERIKADREKVKKALSQNLPQRLWQLPLERPVPGSVSSLFGMKRVFNGQIRGVHRGLDLRGATGTPIKACADGRVALVDNLYYSGNTVYINHGDGVFTAYLHMSEPKVRVGQKVSRGDVVGLVGATGRVTGPHLHLSMIVQGQAVDPQPLLGKSHNSPGGAVPK